MISFMRQSSALHPTLSTASANACRDSMKMSPYELFRNVPFGVVRAARSAPANGALVATPQAPSPTGAAWACGGSTPLATALLACHYDAPNKRGHLLVS